MDERSQHAATDSGEPKGFEARIAKLKDKIGGVVKKVTGEGLEVGEKLKALQPKIPMDEQILQKKRREKRAKKLAAQKKARRRNRR